MAPDTSNEPFDFYELAELWWAEYNDSDITKDYFIALLVADIASGLFFAVHPKNSLQEYKTNVKYFFYTSLTPEQKAEQRSVLARYPELLI